MQTNYLILELAEEKMFAELNTEEQALVLQSTTALNYDDLYKSIKKSSAFFSEESIQADTTLKQKLAVQFRSKHSKHNPLQRSIQQRIPAWAAIAACLCIGVLSWLLSRNNGFGASSPHTIYVHEIDTIYKEIEKVFDKNELLAFDSSQFFQQEQKIVRKPVRRKSNIRAKTPSIEKVNLETDQIPVARIHPMLIPQRIGQSVQDDTLLAGLGGRIF